MHKAVLHRAFLSQHLSCGCRSASSSLPPRGSFTSVPDVIRLVQMLCLCHAGTEVPCFSGHYYPPMARLQPGCCPLPLPKKADSPSLLFLMVPHFLQLRKQKNLPRGESIFANKDRTIARAASLGTASLHLEGPAVQQS